MPGLPGIWLSPAFERPSTAIHFTWVADWPAVREILPTVEAILRPYEPRPHWGKLSRIPGDEVAARYPRQPDFADLAARWDPIGRFRNILKVSFAHDAQHIHARYDLHDSLRFEFVAWNAPGGVEIDLEPGWT